MREILFRGKRLDNGEWVEGYLLKTQGSTYITEPDWWDDDLFISPKNITHAVNPSTVGQFTGLLDKNGKRIFEGDVVEYNDGYDYIDGEVVFEFGAFGIGSCDVIDISTACCDNFANLWQLYWDQEAMDAPELYYCKVIGNIHDNPELLEVTPDE